ncbi:MAG: V-type ATP synthase subunit E [Ruminococcus sp.]|nr:V-type ATP synthase subunit E [Ruminococcus sp.]
MTGLEKIIYQIKLDADSTVQSIKAKCDNECALLLSDAEMQVKAILKDGELKAEKKYNDIIARANSAAELEERKIILNSRQSVISYMVNEALQRLKSLPDDKYFELLLKMISKYSENADGVLSLGSADLNRLPADFEKKAIEASKGKLTLSKVPATIDSGFVLTYGGVDVNCSFSSLFLDNSEKISDAVAKLLFA